PSDVMKFIHYPMASKLPSRPTLFHYPRRAYLQAGRGEIRNRSQPRPAGAALVASVTNHGAPRAHSATRTALGVFGVATSWYFTARPPGIRAIVRDLDARRRRRSL